MPELVKKTDQNTDQDTWISMNLYANKLSEKKKQINKLPAHNAF